MLLLATAAPHLIPALDGPDTWTALVSLVLGCLALAGAALKIARQLWHVAKRVGDLSDELEEESKARKTAEEETKKERRGVAEQLVELRRQIDHLVWKNEENEKNQARAESPPTQSMPAKYVAPKSPTRR